MTAGTGRSFAMWEHRVVELGYAPLSIARLDPLSGAMARVKQALNQCCHTAREWPGGTSFDDRHRALHLAFWDLMGALDRDRMCRRVGVAFKSQWDLGARQGRRIKPAPSRSPEFPG